MLPPLKSLVLRVALAGVFLGFAVNDVEAKNLRGTFGDAALAGVIALFAKDAYRRARNTMEPPSSKPPSCGCG